MKEPKSFSKTQNFAAKKYNLSILRELVNSQTGRGFNALQKSIPGLTPRVLSMRLKELEAMKLIQKNLVLGPKPKIEYMALPKGSALRKAIAELEKWGEASLPIEEKRTRHPLMGVN
ncbi:MAG: helix-turn-helix domain-containing protein [archaeon]